MATKTVVALPGEGIGVEVVDATCELLMGTGLPLKILTPPQGSPLPDETKQAAREADGVLFGAAGPSTSPVVSWLRWEMGAWAGVRPIRFFPGMRSPLGRSRRHRLHPPAREQRGALPGPRGRAGGSGQCHARPERQDREEDQGIRRGGTLRGQDRDAEGGGAHRALRLRPRAEAQGARQARQGHVHHQVERAPPHRRPLSADGGAHRAGGRARVRALPRRRRRAAPRALSQVHGRGAVHEPLRRHPV